MALKFKLPPDGRIRKESEQGQRGEAVRHKGQGREEKDRLDKAFACAVYIYSSSVFPWSANVVGVGEAEISWLKQCSCLKNNKHQNYRRIPKARGCPQ